MFLGSCVDGRWDVDELTPLFEMLNIEVGLRGPLERAYVVSAWASLLFVYGLERKLDERYRVDCAEISLSSGAI